MQKDRRTDMTKLIVFVILLTRLKTSQCCVVLKSPFVLRSNTIHINVLYAQNVEFLEVTPGGAQSNLHSLKG